jgi:hypothetical protein
VKEQTENKSASAPTAATKTAGAPADKALTQLMAGGEQVAAKSKAATPDLERQALKAAESAILDGERALASARAHLRQEVPPPKPGPRRREIVLRMLLAFNVSAMVIVALLPAPKSKIQEAPTPTA